MATRTVLLINVYLLYMTKNVLLNDRDYTYPLPTALESKISDGVGMGGNEKIRIINNKTI